MDEVTIRRATQADEAALGRFGGALMSASPNEPAQRLFERLGFRRTMVEMTRERGGEP